MTAHQKIQHLYARAGFGLTPTEWQEKSNWNISNAIKDLFAKAKNAAAIQGNSPKITKRFNQMTAEEKEKFLKEQRQSLLEVNSEWINRMADSKASALLEKMTLFWHDHFACDPKSGTLAAQYLNSIREHALGNFRDLTLAIARDPAMIRYLNNQQNRKDSPNENFARELMELFTIGRGNYTEQDIKEAARAFTGWSSGFNGQFVFRRFQHDYDTKTFMGQKGQFNGDDIIDIILKRKETARFITEKIYRYFVNEKINEDRVIQLSEQFYRSRYNIGLLMKTIFSSPWFYESENVGTKIKSPVDFLVGLKRQLSIKEVNSLQMVGVQKALGQVLFKPPNVAGWTGGKTWIDNATLMLRLNLAQGLYSSSDFELKLKTALEKEKSQKIRKLLVSIDFEPIYTITKGQNAYQQHRILSNYLLSTKQIPTAGEILKYTDRRNRESLTKTMTIRLMSLPEYQMC